MIASVFDIFLRKLEPADDLLRALLGAGAAGSTLRVIDLCDVAVHMDRVELALLGAERTSDTSCLADIHDGLALVLVRALHTNLRRCRDEFDQLARTCLGTCAAGGTFALVDLCDAVYDVDRVKLTCLHAGAVA